MRRNVGPQRIDAPLNHLIRNALDHGIEPPAERVAAGKPPRGELRLEAHHRAGYLVIVVSDDGRGIDPERVRRKVVARGLATAETVAGLSDAAVLDYLVILTRVVRDQHPLSRRPGGDAKRDVGASEVRRLFLFE